MVSAFARQDADRPPLNLVFTLVRVLATGRLASPTTVGEEPDERLLQLLTAARELARAWGDEPGSDAARTQSMAELLDVAGRAADILDDLLAHHHVLQELTYNRLERGSPALRAHAEQLLDQASALRTEGENLRGRLRQAARGNLAGMLGASAQLAFLAMRLEHLLEERDLVDRYDQQRGSLRAPSLSWLLGTLQHTPGVHAVALSEDHGFNILTFAVAEGDSLLGVLPWPGTYTLLLRPWQARGAQTNDPQSPRRLDLSAHRVLVVDGSPKLRSWVPLPEADQLPTEHLRRTVAAATDLLHSLEVFLRDLLGPGIESGAVRRLGVAPTWRVAAGRRLTADERSAVAELVETYDLLTYQLRTLVTLLGRSAHQAVSPQEFDQQLHSFLNTLASVERGSQHQLHALAGVEDGVDSLTMVLWGTTHRGAPMLRRIQEKLGVPRSTSGRSTSDLPRPEPAALEPAAPETTRPTATPERTAEPD